MFIWNWISKMFQTVFAALVRSKIEYGCQVIDSASLSVLRRVNTIQVTWLRICLGTLKQWQYMLKLKISLSRWDQMSAQYHLQSLALPENHPLIKIIQWHGCILLDTLYVFPVHQCSFSFRTNITLSHTPLCIMNVNTVSTVPRNLSKK